MSSDLYAIIVLTSMCYMCHISVHDSNDDTFNVQRVDLNALLNYHSGTLLISMNRDRIVHSMWFYKEVWLVPSLVSKLH